ncbi:MAG: putative poly polymerase, partial [Thermoleophilia bacterium]|nr:putative poly polymerase [Thermoleophilia bacterium]
RAELELVLHERAWEPLTLLDSWGVLERLEPRLEAALRPPLLLPAIDGACGNDPELNHRVWTLRLAVLVRALGDDGAGWMRWLGFPAATVGVVLELAIVLDAVLTRGAELRELPNSELYRDLGEVSDDAFALAALAADDDPTLLTRLAAFHAALRSTRLTVRGDDVVAAGVPAGPAVGRILGELFLRTLDGELRGEDDERRALAQLASQHDAGT